MIKKTLKQIAAILLCVSFLLTLFSGGASASADNPDDGIMVIDLNDYDENGKYIGSTTTNASDSLTYSIVLGTFTLSGSGAMPDYSCESDTVSSYSSSVTDSFPVYEQTVDYRATVTIDVDMESAGLPPIFSIALYDEKGDVLTRGANYKLSYKASNLTEERTFTLKILNLVGEPLVIDGQEFGMVLRLNVRNGFFDVIVAFFRSLFGLLPEYTWEWKYTGPKYQY